jgi:hypothetical protein
MPKAKPDQVIVHRLELQQSERDAMEAALAGRFVTNGISAVGTVLGGLGAALVPFSGAITALAALWIADRTIEEVVESVKEVKKAGEDIVEWVSPSKTQQTFQYIVSFMQACNGWDELRERGSELIQHLDDVNASPVLKNKLYAFIKHAKMTHRTTGQWPPYTPAKAWIQFYTPQEYYRDHGFPI